MTVTSSVRRQPCTRGQAFRPAYQQGYIAAIEFPRLQLGGQLLRGPGLARNVEGNDARTPRSRQHGFPFLLQDAGNVGIFAPFACANLDEFKRHVFGEAATILFEAMLYPGGHLGAHRNQLDFMVVTLVLLLRIHLSGTAPQLFQLVEVTMFILHHMHDHRAHIYQHPFTAQLPFHAQQIQTRVAGLAGQMVGNGADVTTGVAGTDDHGVSNAGFAANIEGDDVAAFHVINLVDDKGMQFLALQ